MSEVLVAAQAIDCCMLVLESRYPLLEAVELTMAHGTTCYTYSKYG